MFLAPASTPPLTPCPAQAAEPWQLAESPGIRVICEDLDAMTHAEHIVLDALHGHPLASELQFQPRADGLQIRWPIATQELLAPGHDTLALRSRMGLPTAGAASHTGDLPETVAALLLGPQAQAFPSPQELDAALRIRANVARAASRTQLNFDTEAVERPWDFWRYDETRGFHIRDEVSLVDALRRATQPDVSGALYAFSCYRATEYVLLLGLAEELQRSNPSLYRSLEALWRRRAIASAEFHEVFLRETGSLESPIPQRYYVPGDRVWFRNPDEASADAAGFEGSWVIYQGGGHFCNFWQAHQPFDFEGKCLEIYHWRDGTYRDAQGDMQVDEARVAAAVARTRTDPMQTAQVQMRMQRYRDPRGVYAQGGCIDSTREQLRWVCAGTADLVLPTD